MKSRQIALELQHQTALTRDDLIVTPANHVAVSVIDQWPHWPTPIVNLTGPEGAGKTHLASIWANEAQAVTIPADQIEHAAHVALQGQPILIEDIDHQEIDQTALFHLFNTIRQMHLDHPLSSLLLTSRQKPAYWQLDLPDLISRLKAITIVEISEPDDELLAKIIIKLFADRQIVIDMGLANYIIARIERSTQAACEVVAVIDKMALEQKARLNKHFVQKVLQQWNNDTQ